jgi:aminoglycoside phosphotransferase family enzyme/predicted kinase
LAVANIEVLQTHHSVVFLAGQYVYKIKKPVDLGFLDFATLDKRRFFCEEEVRLNRRLAPSVYLGVVPITMSGGQFHFEGDGTTVEWAVKMQRLPDEATLQRQLGKPLVDSTWMQMIGQRLAHFHRRAESNSEIASFGRFDVVAQNARENFQQSRPHVNCTVSRRVFDRLEQLTEEALADHRLPIEARAGRGVPRDTHGDLHSDHIYLFPEKQSPDDLVIIDCIEFNKRFRYADPVADMAFLYMDLTFLGFPRLAEEFASAYFAASNDDDGRALLSFYSAYRAIVRAKVEGFELDEFEIPEHERESAFWRAKKHWLLALSELENADQRPLLLLIGGLPGTGKSTLARKLTERLNAHIIRSDSVRKQLAGLQEEDQSSPSAFGEGIYDARWTDQTYSECLKRAEQRLVEGGRVIIDASFSTEQRRHDAIDLADRYCVPTTFFLCTAEPETVRTRLAQRKNDVSDADWLVYLRATDRWEDCGPDTQRRICGISTDGGIRESTKLAVSHLKKLSLVK